MSNLKEKEYQSNYYLKNKKYLQYKKRINYFEHRDDYMERALLWSNNNKQRKKEYAKEWYLKNKEKRIKYMRDKYNNDLHYREHYRDYQRKWAKKNKDKVKQYREKCREKMEGQHG